MDQLRNSIQKFCSSQGLKTILMKRHKFCWRLFLGLDPSKIKLPNCLSFMMSMLIDDLIGLQLNLCVMSI